jgi:hypothetical protein
MQRLVAQLRELRVQAGRLDETIAANLRSWGMAGDWIPITLDKVLSFSDAGRALIAPMVYRIQFTALMVSSAREKDNLSVTGAPAENNIFMAAACRGPCGRMLDAAG